RMAFPASRAPTAVAALAAGDELFLYSTRGAFHSPGRDRGRIFGRATAQGQVRPLAEPLRLVGREFTHDVHFDLTALAPVHEGIELSPLVPRLTSFPHKTGWPTAVRRPLMT